MAFPLYHSVLKDK